MSDHAIDLLTRSFETRWLKGDQRSFLDLLEELIDLVQNGRLDRLDATRLIAGVTFVPGVDSDPLREEILMVAADLETGQPQSPSHSWTYLLGLISELEGAETGEDRNSNSV
jgi:hypothetical protein